MAVRLWLTVVLLSTAGAAAIKLSALAEDKTHAAPESQNNADAVNLMETAARAPSVAEVQLSQSYCQKGQVLRHRNQYLLAMLHLDQALRLNPSNREALS